MPEHRVLQFVPNPAAPSIVVLPPRREAARGDTLALAALLRFEQAERQLPQPGQILAAVAGPVPLIILAETDVQDPVQRVLDPPMAPHPPQGVLRRPGRAADEVAGLAARCAVDYPLADHHHDGRQPGPQARVPDPLGGGDHAATAGLLPTAPDLFGLALVEVHTGLSPIQHLLERPLDILGEMRLVLLDRQHVLAPLTDDGGGDLLLAPTPVNLRDGFVQVLEVVRFRPPRAGARGPRARSRSF